MKPDEWLKMLEEQRPQYKQSQALLDAAAALAAHDANKPSDYQSQYGTQIQSMLDKIMNREKFKYDFSADPLYQAYKDKYQQQGKLAMMDTMANAAALTGGYGSSYASTAGQQVYQGNLAQLNDIIPQLQEAARRAYEADGADMSAKLGMLQGLENTDYGKYQDLVNTFNQERGYLYGKYQDMSAAERAAYESDFNAWLKDRDNYTNKQLAEQAQSNWEKEFELKKKASKGGGGGGGDGDLLDYLKKMFGDTTSEVDADKNLTGKKNGKYYVNGKEVSKEAYANYMKYR